jgi:ABC-type dipeptide/oligopeptide/nickel transport system permease subunit
MTTSQPALTLTADAEAGRPRRWWRRVLTKLLADRSALLGLALLVTLIALALLAPWLAPADPLAVDPRRRLLGPGLPHLLGTDNLGRDLLSRVMWGARASLGVAALATAAVATLGTVLGLVAGYRRGWFDSALMRLGDLLLALPSIVLALAIVGTLGPSLGNVLIGLVAVWWVGFARIVRSVALGAAQHPSIEAARCLGASDWRVLVVHLLPNALPPVLVLASLELGQMILALSSLSFLGLGVQPPTPEWGQMLNEARPFFTSAAYLMLVPGGAIALATLACNLLGDGLRDALDPTA